jgi:hypothetical protein
LLYRNRMKPTFSPARQVAANSCFAITRARMDRLTSNQPVLTSRENHSRTICLGSLSYRSPAKLECLKCPSGVHSVNSICATSCGFNQRHSFISAAVSVHYVRRFSDRSVPIYLGRWAKTFW